MEEKKVDYSAIFDKMDALKGKVKELCPNAKDQSGIYVFTRESGGFRFAYVGQSLNVLTRIAQHFVGYTKENPQHIDLSLKKYGTYSMNNKEGWRFGCLYFPKEQLDEKERHYIHLYANAGYQMRNHTIGGQDDKKEGLAPNRSTKTYREGLAQGKINTTRLVKELFDKYLDYSIKPPINKVKERKIKEFEELINQTIKENEN